MIQVSLVENNRVILLKEKALHEGPLNHIPSQSYNHTLQGLAP